MRLQCLGGNIHSRDLTQLFAQRLHLFSLCLYDGLKDPSILHDLVNIQLGFLDGTLVLQDNPILVDVEHSRKNANTTIALKYLAHDVRGCRGIVDLVHVYERFLEPRLALNRNKVYAVHDTDTHDIGEDSLDTHLVILGEHAGDEEAGSRHVSFSLVLVLML